MINPRCKVDNTTPIIKPTKHLYIDLPKLTETLDSFLKSSIEKGNALLVIRYNGNGIIGTWSPNAITVTQAWLKEGLKPRALTRDLKWGVPVPLEDYKNKVNLKFQ